MKYDEKVQSYARFAMRSGLLEFRDAYRLHLSCFSLADVIDNFGARSLERHREMMGLVQGSLLVQEMMRIVCLKAGAGNIPACKVWYGRSGELDEILSWKDTCARCKAAPVSRQKFCSVAFPASIELQGIRSRAINQPSLVKPDQLKHWAAGRRPLPFWLARMMLRSLRKHGLISTDEHLANAEFVNDMIQWRWALREVRKALREEWPLMLSEKLGMLTTWVDKKPKSTIVLCEIEGERAGSPCDETFPYVEGFRDFNFLFNVPLLVKKWHDIQGCRVTAEIRVTPYPLPIDDAEEDTPAGYAVRLYLFPVKEA